MASYDCLVCGLTCHSSGGLRRHMNAKHPQFPELTFNEANQHTSIYHHFVNGMFKHNLSFKDVQC